MIDAPTLPSDVSVTGSTTDPALAELAPHFVDMAHRIGMATAATVDKAGRPRTRVVQPVWRWDGGALTGWMSTATDSPKYRHLQRRPDISITYWNVEQDTCTADCSIRLVLDHAEKAEAWERFVETPPPAGFDPGVHPEWRRPLPPPSASSSCIPGGFA